MQLIAKVTGLLRRAGAKVKAILSLTAQNIKNTLKNLWRNAESVAILTLASLGTSHFVGSYVFANPVLNSVIFAEMIGPMVAIGIIWGLLRLAAFRRNRRPSSVLV